MTPRVLIVRDEGLIEREFETDDLSDVLECVDTLDGRVRTLVVVFRGDAHAAVGGSTTSGLVLYVTFDGSVFHQAGAADCACDDAVAVVAGGQAGNYPRRLVVDLDTAKRALRAFVEGGVLAPACGGKPGHLT